MTRIKKTIITQTKISQAIDLLQDLPKKVKEEYTLREAIRAMYPTIRGVLKKGYSYSEVAEMLKQADIKISATTLKQYVQDITKNYKKPNESEVKDKSSIKENIVDGENTDEDIKQNIVEDINKDKSDIGKDTIETIDEDTSDIGKNEIIKPKKLKSSGQTGKTKIESEFNNY